MHNSVYEKKSIAFTATERQFVYSHAILIAPGFWPLPPSDRTLKSY